MLLPLHTSIVECELKVESMKNMSTLGSFAYKGGGVRQHTGVGYSEMAIICRYSSKDMLRSSAISIMRLAATIESASCYMDNMACLIS